MEPLAKRLEEKLSNMSQEELDKEWQKLKHWNEVGPDAEEFIKYCMEQQPINQALDKVLAANQCQFDKIQACFDSGLVKDQICKSITGVISLFRDIIDWCWTERYPMHFVGCFVEDEECQRRLCNTAYRNYMNILRNGECWSFLQSIKVDDYWLYASKGKLTPEQLHERRYQFLSQEWYLAQHEHILYDPVARAVACFQPQTTQH